ncbi:MAG: 50S ribosomal protein L11 methyltransferase [Xanthomonadales bacterium]|nr:50S ribosomal protein L11 methyltransferase [Xanthomonadales bacterium]
MSVEISIRLITPTRADNDIANILAGPLGELVLRFAVLCMPGAPIALCGILDGKQDEQLACLESHVSTQRDAGRRINGRRC